LADANLATELLRKLNDLAAKQAEVGQVDPSSQQRFQVLDALLNKLGDASLSAPFQNIKSEAQLTADASATIRANYEAAARVTLPTPVGGAQRFATGGIGTDTIPAMLSPGEFVINARSSQRFFSQLQSINAGNTPTFRDGGTTNNTTIGDIHVSSSSSGDGRVIARDIMKSMTRELRRGSGKI
jgi:hypothetical protein